MNWKPHQKWHLHARMRLCHRLRAHRRRMACEILADISRHQSERFLSRQERYQRIGRAVLRRLHCQYFIRSESAVDGVQDPTSVVLLGIANHSEFLNWT